MTLAPTDVDLRARSGTAQAAADRGARLPSFDLAIFAGPSLPISALGLPLAVYLPEFFANVLGVSLGVVGVMFLVIRSLDLAVDPVLGGLMDRTRTPLGRYRPWLAAGAVLAMAGSYFVFMAKPGAAPLYLGFFLFVLYLSFSLMALSHAAWASTLASAYHERSRIYGFMQSGLVLAMVGVPLIGAAAGASGVPGAGVRAIGWFVIILAPTTIGLACLRMKERRTEEGRPAPTPVRAYLRLLTRPTVLRIVVTEFCLNFAPAVTASLFFFFFREARGFTTVQANLLLVVYFLGALAGGPVWTLIAKRFGKHRALLFAALYYVGIMSLALVPPRGVLWINGVFIAFSGLAYSAPTIFIRAMLADAADEAELETGGSCTGLLYAMDTSVAKMAAAGAIFITYSLLGLVGFKPAAHAVNTPEAVAGLKALFILLPSAAALLGAAVIFGYRLTEARHKEILASLQTRRADALRPQAV